MQGLWVMKTKREGSQQCPMLPRPTEVRPEKHCFLSGQREATGDLCQQLFGRAGMPYAILEPRVRSEWGRPMWIVLSGRLAL